MSIILLAVLLKQHLLVLLHFVVWLGFTTSWKRTTERKLRVLWDGCNGAFHLFHQVLGWSSCLRSPTNRHAVDFDLRWSFFTGLLVAFVVPCWFYLQSRLRRSLLPMHSRLWYLDTSMTLVRRLGTTSLIDRLCKVLCLGHYSTSELIRLLYCCLNWWAFLQFINMKSQDSPSFHFLRWLKGFACDLRGTQPATRKKIPQM